MLVDTHAHLEVLENLPLVLENAKRAGVSKIITIGTSIASSKRAIDLAEKFSDSDLGIFATVGIHPFDGKDDVDTLGVEKAVGTLAELASTSKRVVGVGESGLDYYTSDNDKRPTTTDDERNLQRKLFGTQAKLADELNLPLIVHCRNGWDEIFEILTRGTWNLTCGGVFHSFVGSVQDLQAAAALGFYVSFSGIVTFSNAQNIQGAARTADISKMLLETDSPYLTPEPFRGQKNEPCNVKIIADFLANLKGLQFGDLYDKTSKNAEKLFNLW